jgi:Flp pilus assembly pilin Flp
MSLSQWIRGRIGSFLAGQDGASMVEYAILLGLLVFVCFVAIRLIGSAAFQLFQVPGWS